MRAVLLISLVTAVAVEAQVTTTTNEADLYGALTPRPLLEGNSVVAPLGAVESLPAGHAWVGTFSGQHLEDGGLFDQVGPTFWSRLSFDEPVTHFGAWWDLRVGSDGLLGLSGEGVSLRFLRADGGLLDERCVAGSLVGSLFNGCSRLGLTETSYVGFSSGSGPFISIEFGYVGSGASETFVLSSMTAANQFGSPDAGLIDAGLSDAGLSDAGLSDAGLSDAGLSDAGLSDAGLSDAGLSDAGLSDAGLSDAGISDAGISDARPIAFATYGCSTGSALVPFVGLLAWLRRRRIPNC